MNHPPPDKRSFTQATLCFRNFTRHTVLGWLPAYNIFAWRWASALAIQLISARHAKRSVIRFYFSSVLSSCCLQELTVKPNLPPHAVHY
jgi:hypothetical protein